MTKARSLGSWVGTEPSKVPESTDPSTVPESTPPGAIAAGDSDEQAATVRERVRDRRQPTRKLQRGEETILNGANRTPLSSAPFGAPGGISTGGKLSPALSTTRLRRRQLGGLLSPSPSPRHRGGGFPSMRLAFRCFLSGKVKRRFTHEGRQLPERQNHDPSRGQGTASKCAQVQSPHENHLANAVVT
jgi:hypothetical protein